jgi:non-heme chloroperoxidase
MSDASSPATFATATVEVLTVPDGGRIHTVHAGSGRAVLLAHGYLLDHSVFEPVFAQLVAAGYRVIAFDQRGHGRSTPGTSGMGSAAAADDYRALLEHFAVEDGVLVGHSLGGFLGLLFCLRHGEFARRTIGRLVLLGAHAGAVTRGSLQNRLQAPLVKWGVIKPLWSMPLTGRPLVASLFGPDAEPHTIELTRNMLLRQDLQISLPLLDAMGDEDYYGRLGEIPIETRVLCGEYDRTCPSWHSRRLGAELPRAKNVWLRRAGHMLQYEAPDEIMQAITAA